MGKQENLPKIHWIYLEKILTRGRGGTEDTEKILGGRASHGGRPDKHRVAV